MCQKRRETMGKTHLQTKITKSQLLGLTKKWVGEPVEPLAKQSVKISVKLPQLHKSPFKNIGRSLPRRKKEKFPMTGWYRNDFPTTLYNIDDDGN